MTELMEIKSFREETKTETTNQNDYDFENQFQA